MAVALLPLVLTWGGGALVSPPAQRRVGRIDGVAQSIPDGSARAFVPDEGRGPLSEASRQRERIGVLLLNLGGPNTLDEVEPFLFNLFSDPEIITLPRRARAAHAPWCPLGASRRSECAVGLARSPSRARRRWASGLNGPLAWIIAKSRAPSSREGYESIGGGSPQLWTTQAQGAALEKSLERRGVSAKSYVAMRYWHPYTTEALAAIKADGIQRLIVLPLYPQFSISTSGSSLRLLEREFYADQELRQIKNTVVPAWYNRPGYVNSVAKLIAEKCDVWGADAKTTPHIFFSAHGLPTKYIDELGDPYKKQMEATVRYVMVRLKQLGYENECTLAYQSRVGPVEWLQPYTDEKIRELAARGVTSLVVVPISFVSEHIETLEEIDGEYKELADEVGIERWERVPALGLDDDFIDDLAAAVIEALPSTDSRVDLINEGRRGIPPRCLSHRAISARCLAGPSPSAWSTTSSSCDRRTTSSSGRCVTRGRAGTASRRRRS